MRQSTYRFITGKRPGAVRSGKLWKVIEGWASKSKVVNWWESLWVWRLMAFGKFYGLYCMDWKSQFWQRYNTMSCEHMTLIFWESIKVFLNPQPVINIHFWKIKTFKKLIPNHLWNIHIKTIRPFIFYISWLSQIKINLFKIHQNYHHGSNWKGLTSSLPTNIMSQLDSKSIQIRIMNYYWNSLSGDYCNSMPCQNGGSCSNRESGFSCLCRQGFVGLRCQTGESDESPTIHHQCI